MKKFFAASFVVALAACSSPEEAVWSVADGAYERTSATITQNGELTENNQLEMKIYSGGRYMFAALDNDGVANMGCGEARWNDDGTMTEMPMYQGGMAVNDISYRLAMAESEAGFSQSITGLVWNEDTVDLNEEWKLLSTVTSPYDGLWKLEAREVENDAIHDFHEVKMIGGGHFIWYHTYSTDTSSHADFGYGTFEVGEGGAVVETGMHSSLEGFTGASLTFQLIDDDTMEQTYMQDSVAVTQRYTRL